MSLNAYVHVHIGTHGKDGGKEGVDEACLCICGFLQPQPYIQKILPTLLESNDGFADRILVCSPTPHLLMEREVEEWCDKHRLKPLQTLGPVYKAIAEIHEKFTPDSPMYYKYGQAGKQVWQLFSDEMSAAMNSQWETGACFNGNMSKDKRTMCRYVCVLL